MSDVTITQLTRPVDLGEGPHWNPSDEALTFVDAFKGNFHRFYTSTKRHQVLHVDNEGYGQSVTIIIPIEGIVNTYIVTIGRTIGLIEWSASDPDYHVVKPTLLHIVDDHSPSNFFNDGKCDGKGRLLVGTRGAALPSGKDNLHKGSIYVVDEDLQISKVLSKVSLSNGLTWNNDNSTFFYIDTLAYSVDSFDYNAGVISNRRVVLDYKAAGLDPDVPDGMTIDIKGQLWIANYFGHKIICIDPETGTILNKINMPVKNCTSLCWGGHDYSTLYVTSGNSELTKEELEASPQAGCTFAITGLNTKGYPATNFKADLRLVHKKLNIEY